MADIFISYAREDRTKAQQLAAALEDSGWSVWWDTRLKAGEIWDEVIEKEIKTARTVVVLWSHASVNSRWVKREARIADKRRILAPVRLQEVDIPLEFSDVQAADLIDWQGDRAHDGLRQLIHDIIAISSEPSGSKESRDHVHRAPAEKILARKPKIKGWLPYLLAVGAVATLALGMGYFTYEQQDGHRLTSREENAAIVDLDGIYRAAGKNPDGTLYTGEVVIRRENAVYYITWKIGKQTLFGSGTLNKNILNIRWGSGDLVSYVVQTNRILQGSWANGQGTETLNPYGSSTPYGSSKRDEAR